MNMLTKEEKAWIKKMERLLKDCPKRFGFYSTGDPCISVFDKTREHLFDPNKEFVHQVDECDAGLGMIIFPTAIHAVRG